MHWNRAQIVLYYLILSVSSTTSCFVKAPLFRAIFAKETRTLRRSISEDRVGNIDESQNQMEEIFDTIVMNRYACTRFQRYSEQPQVSSSTSASISNPHIVRRAIECLDISRRAPSGFNAQPYRVILVHERKEKEALAQYCLGRNADRVRDSDVTMIFLADKEVARDWTRFRQFLKAGGRLRQGRISESDPTQATKKLERSIFKAQVLVLLFSSGWPLPRILASPFSLMIRCAVSIISSLTRRRVLVPSLATAETWSTKNTMLVAMTYMLGCTSRGLATCPMEGFNVGGIRKVLQIPRRFAVPIIVSTGTPYSSALEVNDDAGMSHGPANKSKADYFGATPRFPLQDVLFDGMFGRSIEVSN